MNIRNSLTRRVSASVAIVLVLLLVACSGSSAVSASAVRSIANKLNCVCGCEDILSECDCDTARQLTTVIQKGLARGHSEEQIIQDLVQQYGQRILVQ